MGRQNPGPDATELRRWKESGYTYDEMAAMATEKYNWPWTKSGIQQRLRRAGLTNEGALSRHDYTVPWTVSNEHTRDEVVINLRRLGRKLEGKDLTPRDEKRLGWFLSKMERENVVIAYSPKAGWLRIDRDTVPARYLHPDPRVPIIPPEAKQLELAKRRQEALKAQSKQSGRRLAALQEEAESKRAG